MNDSDTHFDEAFTRTILIGNNIADENKQADIWDVADGILAGALQFWLYSRQPCGDKQCEDCSNIDTAEARMINLRKAVEEFASESDYFHTANDRNAGRA